MVTYWEALITVRGVEELPDEIIKDFNVGEWEAYCVESRPSGLHTIEIKSLNPDMPSLQELGRLMRDFVGQRHVSVWQGWRDDEDKWHERDKGWGTKQEI